MQFPRGLEEGDSCNNTDKGTDTKSPQLNYSVRLTNVHVCRCNENQALERAYTKTILVRYRKNNCYGTNGNAHMNSGEIGN